MSEQVDKPSFTSSTPFKAIVVVVVLAAAQEYELLARNRLDEPVVATPAVADDRLYIRTDSTLYCIGSGPASTE